MIRMTYFRRLCEEIDGQDLIEYTLLLAFVVLAAAALFIQSGQSVSKIWGISNGTLQNAATAATSSGS